MKGDLVNIVQHFGILATLLLADWQLFHLCWLPYCKSLGFTHHTLQTYLAHQATSKA